MKTNRLIIILLLTFAAIAAAPNGWSEPPAAKSGAIRVLLVTGGHGFEQQPFFTLFKSWDDITATPVEQPKAQASFKPEAASQCDVIVLYDMWQNISDEAKQNFTELLKQGKGLVAMHHCLANYQDWPEFAKIVGGKYRLKKTVENGVEQPGSTYKHGVRFNVHVANADHPVTRGLKDFEIHDETYGNFDVGADVTPLLTTEEPTSGKTIAWARTEGKARVVYIQLGHDHFAYENPNFKQLVAQAIRWTAGK